MFCMCFTFIFLIYFVTCAEVVIDFDGGYKNVLVAVNPEISETKIQQLLLDLERTFKEASDILQSATRGQVFFKEVIFLIPKRYSSISPSRKWIKYNQESKHPDIFITNNDLFDNPYTIQHAGCGKQGLRIHIPSKFLTSAKSSKAKALVREWAHYRYGVFDENGYPGDELFPSCYKIPGSDITHVTSCTNEKAIYEFRINSEVKEDNISATCNPIPVRGRNDRIQSSLMDKVEFPKATHFCDDEGYPHNRNALSKHNAFCKEQSTWKVISQHDDFRSKRKGKHNNVVSFKYVMESEPRFIVAVDSSKNMTLYDRLDLLRNAFSYFLLYSMPENSTAGLINLRNTSDNPLLINLQNQADAERLIDAFPEASGEDSVCVECGISKGLKAFQQYGEIVIATATDITEETYKNVARMLDSKKLPIHILFFKKRLKEPPLLQKLSIHSGGKFFYIVEDFSSEYPVSSLTLLYEAFRSIYQGFSWMNHNHVLVDKMTFYNGNSPRYSMSFTSDKSMKNFQVLLTGPHFIMGPPVIKDKILLSYGNESYAPGHPSFVYKIKIPAYVFRIEDPQPGTWTLSFERKPGYDNPLVVMIRSSTKRYNEIINLQPWLAVEDTIKSSKPKHPPVAMYVDVRKGNQPITNVKVTAHISQPNTNKEILLELYDGGEGDPDITKNDGIFSRYFRNTLDTGYYFFTFVVESWNTSMKHQTQPQAIKNSHCCGSSIPVNLAYDSGSFKRVASYRSFYLNKEKLETHFPPRRINDLRVDSIQISENNVTFYVLNWTAPGDNYDTGTAANYELRVFRSRDDTYSGFDTHYVQYIDMWSVHGSVFIPAVAGTIQSAIVELKNLSSGIYYLAMRAVAFTGAKGDISNIVEIMYTKPDIMDPSINPTGIEPITGDPNGITESNESSRYMLSDNTRLAIGLSCGILFIFLITGLILYFYLARYRKHKKEPQTALSQNTQKIESNDTLCRSTGNGNISIISPVNSWAADSLLTHYETLKKDKNSGFKGKMVAPSANASDSTSIASSKYSYNEKMNSPASFYDSVYFNQYEDRDDVNYPYNPRFVPFNPTYTSSLRRPPTVNTLQQYPPNNVNFYDSATLNGRRTYQLKTDV
ncbi:calcium-activated chloride channel regulator 2-like isoform X2 [Stegodyphus dumicola]|uniref:calcium-activated chloride channel regulator 2-like isoform X2 n=1 Tax=Stegodyphus dumicola TaxID=202533 RepID=UPI0015AD4ABC|nr:calcium-activated chloride channel regulator 2-like isoform X2 [Stegodyphus dumicola]